MEETNSRFLGEAPVGSLMQRYAIPCIISLLVGALYNIVDQIFIANATYLGSYGNAANTVVFPLTVIALAVAVMIGDGCCAYVSLSLGRKEPATAKRSVGNAIIMVVVSSLILTGIYLNFMDQILAMFGGTVNAETFRYSREYFYYIALGIPFYMFGQALNPIIRSILDPVFIFVFKWGMMGAAVATVIGQIVTAVLAVWYILHMKLVRPSKKDFKLSGKICRRTLLLGITSLLSQISLVASMAAINNMILEVFPLQLIGIFGAANESSYYTDFALKAFRIYLCMMVLACVNKACFIFLQAMGKAMESTMLSMVREIVFGVGFALLLPLFFGLDGVLYSMPLSDILTFIIALILITATYRELRQEVSING